jgi:phosphomannomutase
MNRAVVRRTSAGLARYLKAQGVASAGVVVARDSRRMSDLFAEDAAAVFAAHDVPVWVVPTVAPTPVAAFATRYLKAAAGVMVTASHNPPEYNGYKVYWSNGAQIIPPHDAGIAAAIQAVEPANQVPLLDREAAKAKGLWREVGPEMEEAYFQAVEALRRHPRGTPDLKIVYTALHGVGGRWALEAFRRAGFAPLHCVQAQQEPDGAFPTVRFPNPEEPVAMDLSKALAKQVGADLILANDPDADRLAIVVRERSGNLRQLTGNEVGILMGHYLLTAPRRPDKALVITTIVSSTQLRAIARDLGALYDETLTGFKWVANRAMEREQKDGAHFVFGYEEALGYTVGSAVRDKDGVGSALVFADLVQSCRERGVNVTDYLEEIQRRHGLYAAKQKSFTLPGLDGAAQIAQVLTHFRERPPERLGQWRVAAIRDYEKGERRVVGGGTEKLTLPASNVLAYELSPEAHVTLRPSGTEPKVKYYFELKEDVQSGEPMESAQRRAQSRLSALEAAFLELAKERGQKVT